MDFLETVKNEYVDKPYDFWKDLIGKDPIIVQDPTRVDYEVDISPVWEKEPNGSILVLVSESSHLLFNGKMRTLSFVVKR